MRADSVDATVAIVGKTCSGVLADSAILNDMQALYRGVDEQCGRLDVVVANAGIGDHAPLRTRGNEIWRGDY